MTRKALTANAPIGEWLDHPEGGAIIRELLAQGGFDEQVPREYRHFVEPLAKRRNVQVNHVEAVIQITAKPSLFDLVAQ